MTADATTIRLATATDAPALARLRWRWRAEEKNETTADRDAFLRLFQDWVVSHLDTHLPFVAEVDGVIVGMAWLMLAPRVPSPDRQARTGGDLQSVYVVPELRDGGVGAALLAGVLGAARTRGLEFVTVHSSVRALPFYQRQGFTAEHTWLEWQPA